MRRFRFIGGVVAVAALTIGQASADVTAFFNPTPATIGSVGGTTVVSIVADMPDAVAGWGLDVSVADNSIASIISSSVSAPWIGVSSPDGDDLAGLAPPPSGIAGTGVVLATLTLQGNNVGSTDLILSVTPGDLTEGFVLDDGEGNFTPATFINGRVNVIPEPGALALLVIGALVGLRRR
jgi:hypothetical protein